MKELEEELFNIGSDEQFLSLALKIFRLQIEKNPVYAEYISLLGVDPAKVNSLLGIPFLPISFFKEKQVVTGEFTSGLVFQSSGTSGQVPSKHFVRSGSVYERSFLTSFRLFYGNPADYCILALLPSYLERKNSSLVYMMDHLIRRSDHPDSGFYLDDLSALSKILESRNSDRHNTILIGVSFALLDLAEKFPRCLSDNIILMETGGMKGRREELIRKELHSILSSAFGLEKIHSEYGMTELLSQAYSKGDGRFLAPGWMKVLPRDLYDPFTLLPPGNRGGINIIDLANIYSCSFIETGDIGTVHVNGEFEISGRMDHSETRGCNLMVV